MKRKKRLLKGIESLDVQISEHKKKADFFEKAGKSFAAEHARKEVDIYTRERDKKKRKLEY